MHAHHGYLDKVHQSWLTHRGGSHHRIVTFEFQPAIGAGGHGQYCTWHQDLPRWTPPCRCNGARWVSQWCGRDRPTPVRESNKRLADRSLDEFDGT
eukprot:scaffold208251_cov30-Tisochrysis_lutea.AAC.4